MKKYIYFVALALVCIGSVSAQERTAAGAVETQMTWSALSDTIRATNLRVTQLDSKVEQISACGKDGKVYAPGTTGPKPGCLEGSTDNGTTMTTILNTLNSLKTTVTNLNNNIVNCGNTGKIWNGSTCITPTTTVPAGTMCGATSYSSEAGSPIVRGCGGIDPKSGCPAGYSAATAPIYGGKHGQSIGWCFKN